MKNGLFIIIGIFIGWCSVSVIHADSCENNSYRTLLCRIIDVVTQIEVNTKETADNTAAIREKLGAK